MTFIWAIAFAAQMYLVGLEPNRHHIIMATLVFMAFPITWRNQ